MPTASPGEFRWVDTKEGLAEVVAQLQEVDKYAIDTEFHRERTYFPHLALVQIAWEPDHLVLIDPLAVAVAPLADVFKSDNIAVLHAASQDLEVLEHTCGAIPGKIFDTQVAAGFMGFSTPSLSVLHDKLLNISLSTSAQLTDWLARPLSSGPLQYAASDVAWLLELSEVISDDLRAAGRLKWAEDECELERLKARGPRDPLGAWLRCKPIRKLSGKALTRAQVVATWREQRAIELDIPPRFVLGDLGLVGVAERAPTTMDQLAKIRGLDLRGVGKTAARDLIDVVAGASDAKPQRAPHHHANGVDKELRPAVTLVSAWLTQYAKELELDPTLLATRRDIEAFIAGDQDARLGKGWRNDLIGTQIEALLEGEASVSFDLRHGLVMEPRQGN